LQNFDTSLLEELKTALTKPNYFFREHVSSRISLRGKLNLTTFSV
jgi:hypothetical protein